MYKCVSRKGNFMAISYYNSPSGTKLAYVHTLPLKEGERLPAVVFLGGFKSDMAGTKAIYLEEHCKGRGQEFLRFDYSGHGKSSGDFSKGTIGSWKQDAMDIISHVLKDRDIILVGSSMGGWIALRLLIENPSHICAVVGIAAAPDFTKDIENMMSKEDHEMMERLGRLEIPNDYSDEPYIFTRKLLEDGREQSLLDERHNIGAPLVLIQGKLDRDVPWKKAIIIKEYFIGSDTEIIFIEDGDHRLSREEDLKVIDAQVRKLSGL